MLLINSAKTWKHLCNYTYGLTYGRKKKLYTINLAFKTSDFFHMAGFQYLDDLASLPKFSKAKYIDKVIDGTITLAQIEKGQQYEESVKPRLLALENLEDILNNPFSLYSVIPRFYPFVTQIKFDYLIRSEYCGVSFLFLIQVDENGAVRTCDCTSVFMEGERDYTANQRRLSLLRVTRTELSTGVETTVFKAGTFKESIPENKEA